MTLPRARLQSWTRLAARPARFLLVGISGVGVSTGVLWGTTQLLGVPPPAGGLAAAVTSTFTNFLLNDLFTWRDRRSPSLRVKAIRMVRYYGTTAVGNLVYLAVLTLLIGRVGLALLPANIVAIGIGGGLNYIVHNLWTWQRTRPDDATASLPRPRPR